ncbi:methyltransferase family protein [Burkholderia guangdongensis]|uniref:methyltransferase family protein n=1 Tax=Burkholderia guangdongensis TaxID=1792500 RepID=UPI0015C75CF9|nr:isoprenylcysteine carboxylmethyltransferase family protein [Burkholderia guangdongensis]
MMPSPKLAFLSVFGTAGYLALPILGFGGWTPYFSNPARMAVVLVTIALAIVGLFTRGNLSTGVREDRANRWVLPVFGVLGLLAAYLSAWSDRHDFWTIGAEGIRWIGVVLFVVGGAVRMWPVFVLGDRFSGLVAIQPGHTLVTDGIYRFIRNPSYLGLIVNAFGWALAFRSVVGVLLAAALIPPLVARMHAEEALLREQFGAEYDAYFARTWRLLPGVY